VDRIPLGDPDKTIARIAVGFAISHFKE